MTTNGTNVNGVWQGASGYKELTTAPSLTGINIGSSRYGSTSSLQADVAVGVSKDANTSGLIATLSGLTVGTIPSEKLGNFYIHY